MDMPYLYPDPRCLQKYNNEYQLIILEYNLGLISYLKFFSMINNNI